MTMTIALEADEDWESSGSSWDEIADQSLNAALAHSAYPDIAQRPRDYEVSLALTSDEQVRGLNREWRKKDRPTNVLSFPMLPAEELENVGEGPPLLLGDIALAHGTCQREASEKGIGLADHARHLMVHGMLHLLGYDHMTEEEATDMEMRETRALAAMGLADPYGDRD